MPSGYHLPVGLRDMRVGVGILQWGLISLDNLTSLCVCVCVCACELCGVIYINHSTGAPNPTPNKPKSGLAAVKAAVRHSDDMFTDMFGEKCLVSIPYNNNKYSVSISTTCAVSICTTNLYHFALRNLKPSKVYVFNCSIPLMYYLNCFYSRLLEMLLYHLVISTRIQR